MYLRADLLVLCTTDYSAPLLLFIQSYLSLGQDVFTGGFAGALYGGLLCASSILHRNLLTDLKVHAKGARKRKSFRNKD